MKQFKITSSITNRDVASLSKYISDVSHIDMITPDEEIKLSMRIQQGDQKALDKLVSANLRFVISVANSYQSTGLPLGDLIQEGNIGLVNAAKKYDHTKGFKFISYAVWWIRESIMKYITDHSGIVRLPSNQKVLIGRINKATNTYLQENGSIPSVSILSSIINEPEDRIESVMNLNTKGFSIDAPLGDDDDNSAYSDTMVSDFDSADSKVEKEGLLTEFDKILSTMGRSGQVLKHLYGIGCTMQTMDELSVDMDLSRERIRQLKESGLRAIRRHKNYMDILKKYC